MADLLGTIKDLCVRGKRVELIAEVKRALAEGIEAKTIMTDALIPAMSVVGEKYSSGEYFLPHMMLGARAMSEAHGGARKPISRRAPTRRRPRR